MTSSPALRWLRTMAVLLVALVLGACITAPAAQRPAAVASSTATTTALDGQWQGTLAIDKPRADAMTVRLGLAGDRVTVNILVDGQWREAKPGAFRSSGQQTSAVLHATDAGTDQDGRWVESWVFAVSQLDARHLLVEWSRLVNNLDLPRSQPNSVFAVRGSGVLTRH